MIYFLLTRALLVNDSLSVFDAINLFYITLMIKDLVTSYNIYSFI